MKDFRQPVIKVSTFTSILKRFLFVNPVLSVFLFNNQHGMLNTQEAFRQSLSSGVISLISTILFILEVINSNHEKQPFICTSIVV